MEITPIRGLTNPASLCFLNSTIQQLIQFQSFRTHVLALPDDNSLGGVESVSYNSINIHQHFLRQLKALFVQLSCADEIDPVDTLAFAQTILDPRTTGQQEEDNSSDDDGEDQRPCTLDPDEQMDVSSFLSTFLGQLATALSENDENFDQLESRSRMSQSIPLFRDVQGEIVNHLIVDRSTSEASDKGGAMSTSTSSTELFFSLSVCVGEVLVENRNIENSMLGVSQINIADEHKRVGDQRTLLNNLESSLSHFFREELVQCMWATSGTDNAQLSGEHTVALPVTRARATLRRESLPKHLFIHLKRFRFDHDKMRQVKLHDRFDFPFELDVAQYTTRQNDEETWAHSNNTGTATTTSSSSSSSSNNSNSSRSSSSTRYELSGVIVHRGSARNGHYFSLVKQRSTRCTTGLAGSSRIDDTGPGTGSDIVVSIGAEAEIAAGTGTGTGTGTGRWYKADDEEVIEFDPADMAEVAFGHSPRSKEESENADDGGCDGVERIADDTVHSRTKKSRNRKQSAFMLIYDMVT